MLLSIAQQVEGSADIWVVFYRDAWQVGVRPRILDRVISRARLGELSEVGWKQVLNEAYACLNPHTHRGRGSQTVTLSRKGKTVMDVSPHLYIYTIVWETTPAAEVSVLPRVQRAFQLLKPIHEIVTRQSKSIDA